MKGATAVCDPDVRLLEELLIVSRSLGFGVQHDEDPVQVADQAGRLLTMFGDAAPAWEWRDGATNGEGLSTDVDLDRRAGFAVECRWESLFCQLMHALARRVADLWVVDGDGILWPAATVQPDKVRL